MPLATNSSSRTRVCAWVRTSTAADASGSTAFRNACLEVAAVIADVAIAIGVDKPGSAAVAGAADGIERLVKPGIPIAAGFALMAEDYMRATGTTPEQIAAVAVKNHNNAALNPKFDPNSSGDHTHSFEDFPIEEWDRAMGVNVTGMYWD